MKETTLPVAQLALIAVTRGMLGAGLGLLLGGRLSPDVRKAVGTTLVAVGIVTTFPLAIQVFGGRSEPAEGASPTAETPGLSGTWEEREARRTAAAA
jgi:hypothetical protein